jgi:hypothetical protein
MNALERLKEEYRNASRTEITDSSAGYSAGLRFAIRVLEEAEHIPAPKPYRAKQVTPCISRTGVFTMEEIT